MTSTAVIQDQSYPALSVTPPSAGGVDAVWRNTTKQWEQAIDDWTVALTAQRRSVATIQQRRWQLRRLAETYGHRSPWKLSTQDLEIWLNNPAWGPAAAQSARSAVRSFYGWAVQRRRTKRNPAEHLGPIKTSRGRPRPVRDEVVERVLATADRRMRLMVMLAYYGGLRAGEIAGLRWADLDSDAMTIRGKGEVERAVPVHPLLTAELNAWRDGGATGYRYHVGAHVWVFPGNLPGRGLHPRYVSRLLSNALGDGFTGHQLRHGFAMRVLDRTNDLAAVQDLLGHASPVTTRTYAAPTAAALRAAVDAL